MLVFPNPRPEIRNPRPEIPHAAPSVSVVTVVKNAAHTIAECMESVREQTFPAEHVIVDGGSTDGTLDVIRRNLGTSATLVSEPDRGIYDAMNKGLNLASGDVAGILNADDVYAGPTVIEEVARVFAAGADSCYGDLLVVDRRNPVRVIRRWLSGDYDRKRFYWGWMPPHPTFFARRSLYRKLGAFRLDLRTAADYELMLRFLLKHGVPTVYIPRVLVRMRSGGLSDASLKRRLQANLNDRMAWKINGLKPYAWTLWLKPLRKLGQFVQTKTTPPKPIPTPNRQSPITNTQCPITNYQ